MAGWNASANNAAAGIANSAAAIQERLNVNVKTEGLKTEGLKIAGMVQESSRTGFQRSADHTDTPVPHAAAIARTR